MTDERLEESLSDAVETERAIRFHLQQQDLDAAERARGEAAYRHAAGLRIALGDWIETRAVRA